jgi:hypothetical protein
MAPFAIGPPHYSHDQPLASAEIIHWHGTLEVIDDRRTVSS